MEINVAVKRSCVKVMLTGEDIIGCQTADERSLREKEMVCTGLPEIAGSKNAIIWDNNKVA